ncbi:MAG: DUF4398 domain-containing protein [Pseudohongiella sp.]|nr:DUF4398 domain-containing protein [Pseudohongiella sp.]MDO9520329.1 DUF4398 domain-containing protein [Pseudohongiella sp.]
MTKEQSYFSPRGKTLRLILGTSIFLVLAACASAPLPPTQQLQAAETAIRSAEQESVAEFSPLELRQAHDKLNAARVAVQAENMELALRLAHESRVSAELATARTAELKAKAVNDEMQQSINAMQQEAMRTQGSSQ